jgi:DNA polymerase III delta prime subunit
VKQLIDSFEKYILEYIRDWEKKLLLVLVGAWVISILLPIIGNLFFIHKSYGQIFSASVYYITILTLIYFSVSIVSRNFKNNKNFWSTLSTEDREILSRYLDVIEDRTRNTFESTFDPNQNYVTLSGIVQEAYEEKMPGRSHIKNLDRYLLHPEHKRVLIYGSPGSGKSTTLYKAFLNYRDNCKARKGKSNYVPIFIHASEIAGVLKRSSNASEDLIVFLEEIYKHDLSQEVKRFTKLLSNKPQINIAIIIDALDEFIDKRDRDRLFDFLALLIKNTSENSATKWILSCREEEYRAYSKKLKVDNVRVQPMNLRQVDEFLRKQLQTLQSMVGFDRENIPKIRKTLFALKKAEGQRETFLTNPYYLSLWLYQLALLDSDRIPSIEKLHNFEIKREICKGMGKSPNDVDEIESALIESTLSVLSVLSFYLLKVSLEKETILGVSLNTLDLFALLYEGFASIPIHHYDSLTRKRLDLYSSVVIESNRPEIEDIEFMKLLKSFREITLRNSAQYSDIKFLIFISSVMEQASKNRLIKVDFDRVELSGFFNQRAGDYLAARYLQVSGLNQFLEGGKINFWLSRSIAIAIAISKHPQSILGYAQIPQDPVLETSIVDGLTLIPSQKKSSIADFVNLLVSHLLDEERLFGEECDICDPLIVLREVRRLCLSGYSPYINLPTHLFKKLLRYPDSGISEAAVTTLLTHCSQVGFKRDYRNILFKHLIYKALSFEFIFEGSTQNIWLALKESKR